VFLIQVSVRAVELKRNGWDHKKISEWRKTLRKLLLQTSQNCTTPVCLKYAGTPGHRDRRRAVNCRTKRTGLYWVRPSSVNVGYPHALMIPIYNHFQTTAVYTTVIFSMSSVWKREGKETEEYRKWKRADQRATVTCSRNDASFHTTQHCALQVHLHTIKKLTRA